MRSSLLLRLRPPAVLAAVCTLAGVVVGCGENRDQQASVAVTRGDVVAWVSADGRIEPPQELSLDFEGSGRITDVAVKDGDRVRRGQVLARLENDTQRGRLGAAEAALDSAQASLTATRSGLSPVEQANLARQTDEARVAVVGAQRDLDNARRVGATNVGGLSRAVARARVTGEEADLRTQEVRLAQEQARVSILRSRFEEVRGQSDAAREELSAQLDRRRDAMNRVPPDIIQMNNAQARVEILIPKIEDLEADEGASREELNTASADVRAARRDVDASRTALRDARRRLGDASDELRNGAATVRQQVDSARSALAASQSALQTTVARNQVQQQVEAQDVAAGIASVSLAQSQVRDARKALDDTVLRAPTEGVVGHVEAKVGQLVAGVRSSPGAVAPPMSASPDTPPTVPPGGGLPPPASAGQMPPAPGAPGGASGAPGGGAPPGGGQGQDRGVLTLSQTQGLQVKANFDQTDAANLHTGDEATITVDALPEQVFHGRVASIDPFNAVEGNIISYEVTLVLDGPDLTGLRSGMTATANVEVARAENVLTVPRTAVRSPQGVNPSVIVVLPGGRQELRQVATGLQSDTRVQILAGVGLGERVLRTIAPPPERG